MANLNWQECEAEADRHAAEAEEKLSVKHPQTAQVHATLALVYTLQAQFGYINSGGLD